MKYTIVRKLNLKKRLGLDYETADLGIIESESKEEAMKELDEWTEEWLKKEKEKLNDPDKIHPFEGTEHKKKF